MSSADDTPVSDPIAPKTPLLPSDLLLGLATTPVVVAFAAIPIVQELVLSLSEGSEEVFRGARLPVLHFPNQGSY
ncbi:MAG: hypothetical protein P5702_07525 [Limnospira sp. PMC 1291.21]|uniref:Uncharacterized protein n=3 Tax=Limnospira TaxID=2596745 RepID=A0A9P1KB13_9CYAN|nr:MULTISPECIES: hypothetical protein [Limnospira]EKD10191.1 hypothetical protein SPLC1_S102210 [Arthrospira platensis C1]MBD2667896.1 hypothetical protein [Arthrospira platensis FACHB-439]MDC0837265.1 hypothetical protein [Limnoraphis robusta]MDT9181306.1 hypothetical protein [Limnospira sp. PMC 289.06]MDY7053077.1 hypothetical protein [Limnospira fusiformis LS22]QJB28612.1 hypothetical protein HFV01_25890 [Limnospira fusiformis SAG 85.79]RAQ47767.1 hypothetical protein B9S53_03635 [Arthros